MWYYYFPPSRRFGIEAMTLVANGVDFFFFFASTISSTTFVAFLKALCNAPSLPSSLSQIRSQPY